MGCHVVPFPAPPVDRCRALARSADIVAGRLADQHAPILSIAAELLELDDDAFARRLDLMRGAEAGALLADLLVAFQHAAADVDLAGRTLFVIRARLKAGLAHVGAHHEN